MPGWGAPLGSRLHQCTGLLAPSGSGHMALGRRLCQQGQLASESTVVVHIPVVTRPCRGGLWGGSGKVTQRMICRALGYK